jgi:hypothetical protein
MMDCFKVLLSRSTCRYIQDLLEVADNAAICSRSLPEPANGTFALATYRLQAGSSARQFAHSVPVHSCTLTASSSLAWPLVSAHSETVHPCTLAASSCPSLQPFPFPLNFSTFEGCQVGSGTKRLKLSWTTGVL